MTFTPTELFLIVVGLGFIAILLMGIAWNAGLRANEANWNHKINGVIREWADANKHVTAERDSLRSSNIDLKRQLDKAAIDLANANAAHRNVSNQLQAELAKNKTDANGKVDRAPNGRFVSRTTKAAEQALQQAKLRRTKTPSVKSSHQADALLDPMSPGNSAILVSAQDTPTKSNNYHQDSDASLSSRSSGNSDYSSPSSSSSSSDSGSSSSSCSGGGCD